MIDHGSVVGTILAKEPYGEYGERLTMLTRERGKISATINGIHKANARWGVAFEPFSIISASIYEKGRSITITGADEERVFRTISQSYSRAMKALAITRVVNTFGQYDIADAKLFDLYIGTISLMDTAQLTEDEDETFLMFEEKMLKFLGYEHSGQMVCSVCGEKLDGNAWFMSRNGYFVCNNCRSTNMEATFLSANIVARLAGLDPHLSVEERAMAIVVLDRLLLMASKNMDVHVDFLRTANDIKKLFLSEVHKA